MTSEKEIGIAEYLQVDKTIKQETCEKHGAYESRNVFRAVWSKCPNCAAELQAIREKEDAELQAQMKHNHWLGKLKEAGIPDRFKSRTLDTYIAENEGQRRALSFATEYAEKFEEESKSGRSAIFCGMPGTGKTHLSIGIALEIMKNGKSALFTTVQRIMRRMKETFRRDSEDSERDVIDILTYPDLLIIDEIGVQFGSEFEKNLMFDILNERYEKCRPTLLLSNLTIPEVKAFLGARIYDRLKEDGGKFVSFDWASHRGN